MSWGNSFENAYAALKEGQYETAFDHFHAAAAEGNTRAFYRVGVMYEYGLGTKADSQAAFEWYLKSAQTGNNAAKTRIGDYYRLGKVVEKNLETAIKWYQNAASYNFAKAQYRLGELYQKGEGVAKDWAMAEHLFEKAAKQGYVEAMMTLGKLYEKGSHLSPNPQEKAAYWYQQAADHDNPEGLYRLALLYMDGQGVPRNMSRAKQLLRAAAKQNHLPSIHLLQSLDETL